MIKDETFSQARDMFEIYLEHDLQVADLGDEGFERLHHLISEIKIEAATLCLHLSLPYVNVTRVIPE